MTGKEMNMEKENVLGTMPIPKLLMKFAVPSVISMLVNSIYNLVDQIFIGQGVGYHTPGEKGKEVSTIGGFCDLRYDLNDTWAFAIGHGFDNPTDSEAENTHGSAYGILNNQRSYVDAFYQLNANLHFGLEYAYLRTKWAEDDGDTAPDHRIQFTAFYDF